MPRYPTFPLPNQFSSEMHTSYDKLELIRYFEKKVKKELVNPSGTTFPTQIILKIFLWIQDTFFFVKSR